MSAHDNRLWAARQPELKAKVDRYDELREQCHKAQEEMAEIDRLIAKELRAHRVLNEIRMAKDEGYVEVPMDKVLNWAYQSTTSARRLARAEQARVLDARDTVLFHPQRLHVRFYSPVRYGLRGLVIRVKDGRERGARATDPIYICPEYLAALSLGP